MTGTAVLIPTLETARCRLRGYEAKDLPAYVALRQHPDVFRHTTGHPMTEEDAWGRITSAVGHWSLRRYGMWAVEEKATGDFIGAMGFVDARRDSFVSRRGLPEASWWLAADRHGKGYATEIMQALHEWGDRHLVARCTFCGIMAANAASTRLAEAVGYRFKETAVYLGQPSLVMERVLPRKPEWPGRVQPLG